MFNIDRINVFNKNYYFDFLRCLTIDYCLPNAFSNLPDNYFGWLTRKWPNTTQKLIPYGPKTKKCKVNNKKLKKLTQKQKYPC